MIKFLILLMSFFILVPLSLLFLKKYSLQTKLMVFGGGFFIAALGIYLQSTMSLYYSVLLMFGLIFVLAVLFTKQIEKKKQIAEQYDILEVEPVKIKEVIGNRNINNSVEKTQPIQDDWLKASNKEEK